MKYTILFFFLILWNTTQAIVHQVGSSHPYATPNELYLANIIAEGDTIEIESATYSGTATLAVWTPNNLLIRGINGRPTLEADGAYILGKGIWVLAGDNITVENIEFSGATVPDMNGAGIRLDGIGMTVRHCYFHNNENGILTGSPNAGTVTIEYSEFGYNGFGDGFTHNIYINHIDEFIFQFNYSHHAKVGHCIKSRATQSYIFYNRIMDEESGQSSRLIDIPNGGFAMIMGNLLMQGPEAENNNMLGYGLEGLINPASHQLLVVSNTFVNKREASCRFLQIQENVNEATIYNNIFAGIGELVDGVLTYEENNLINSDIASFNLIDESNYDYRLSSNSPAIDYGMLGPNQTVTPANIYVHPTSEELRVIEGNIDAGAYEYKSEVATQFIADADILVYPNPTAGLLSIPEELLSAKYMLYSLNGTLIMSGRLNHPELETSSLLPGIFILKIETNEKRYIQKLIKR